MNEIIHEYWKSLIWTDGFRFTGIAITLWLLIASVVMGGILAVFLSVARVSPKRWFRGNRQCCRYYRWHAKKTC